MRQPAATPPLHETPHDRCETDRRQTPLLIHRRRWRGAGAEPRHALSGRLQARGLRQGAGGHRLHLVDGDALQHAHQRTRGRSGDGRGRSGRQERAVQHHHRFRRHFDGHAGDALFAGLPGSHRRFHRDRGRRPGLRRRGRHRRLRQEHAGLRDGLGAAGPAERLRLRRHHPDGRRAARHHLGVRGGGRPRRWHGGRRPTAGRGTDGHPRPRFLRRHVHGEHHGVRHRGDGHVAAELLRPGSRRRTEAPGRLSGRGRGGTAGAGRHQALGHSLHGGVRERDHRGDGARRFHQRRAAPAGDCECRWRAARHRRLHPHRQSRAGAGGHAPGGELRDVRTHRHRRHPAADEDAARRRPAARRLHDGHRQDPRREPQGRSPPIQKASASFAPSTTPSSPTAT